MTYPLTRQNPLLSHHRFAAELVFVVKPEAVIEDDGERFRVKGLDAANLSIPVSHGYARDQWRFNSRRSEGKLLLTVKSPTLFTANFESEEGLRDLHELDRLIPPVAAAENWLDLKIGIPYPKDQATGEMREKRTRQVERAFRRKDRLFSDNRNAAAGGIQARNEACYDGNGNQLYLVALDCNYFEKPSWLKIGKLTENVERLVRFTHEVMASEQYTIRSGDPKVDVILKMPLEPMIDRPPKTLSAEAVRRGVGDPRPAPIASPTNKEMERLLLT